MALLGVLQINLVFFSGQVAQDWAGLTPALGWADAIPVWVRNHLVSGRALACFSMLFGAGLCIQMDRARARGEGFAAFAGRRLGALALLGVLHSILIWNGDILFPYALLGLLTLPLLRARTRTLVVGTVLAMALSVAFRDLARWTHLPKELIFRHWLQQARWLLEASTQAYGHGTWLEAARWRLWEWNHQGRALLLLVLVDCLPMFLAGMALWRSGILRDPAGRIHTVRKLFHAVFWAALVLSLLPDAWLAASLVNGPAGLGRFLMKAVWNFSVQGLALGFFMGLLILLQKPGWRRLLEPLAPMGRMALSNYLAQSLVCTWVFNGYGLGLWTRLQPLEYALGGLAFYLGQALWSDWWLKRFQFGPAEWLWRTLTYGQPQPLRRPAAKPAT